MVSVGLLGFCTKFSSRLGSPGFWVSQVFSRFFAFSGSYDHRKPKCKNTDEYTDSSSRRLCSSFWCSCSHSICASGECFEGLGRYDVPACTILQVRQPLCECALGSARAPLCTKIRLHRRVSSICIIMSARSSYYDTSGSDSYAS